MWYVGYQSCDNLNEYIRTDEASYNEYIRTDEASYIVGYNSLNLIPSFNSD